MVITFPQNLFIIPFFVNNLKIETIEGADTIDQRTWKKKTLYIFRNFNHSINLVLGSFGFGFYLIFVIVFDIAMQKKGYKCAFIGYNKLSYLVLSSVLGIYV